MPTAPPNTTQWMRAGRLAGPVLYLCVFGVAVAGSLVGGQGQLPPGTLAIATLLTIGLACLNQFYVKPKLQKLSPPPLTNSALKSRLGRLGLWLLLGLAGATLIYTTSIAFAYPRTEQPVGYLAYACIATYWVLICPALAKIKREVTHAREASVTEGIQRTETNTDESPTNGPEGLEHGP